MCMDEEENIYIFGGYGKNNFVDGDIWKAKLNISKKQSFLDYFFNLGN